MTIKQGDTYPPVRATLTDYSGTAIDLTDATVTFRMVDANGNTVIAAGACTITNAATGEVQYQWAEADTDTPGRFRAEFVVEFSGGAIATVPNSNYIIVEIVRNLYVAPSS